MRHASWILGTAAVLATLWVAGASGEAQDWSAARAATARIDVLAPDGTKLREAFGVSVGEPPQILMRLTDLRGAGTVTARFPNGVEVTASAVRSTDPENDLAVLDADGALPVPAQPDETIKWRFYEPVHVIKDDTDPALEGTTDPAEIGSLRIVPMTGDYAPGLSVMHSCGRWIGITGRISDEGTSFTYVTSIESVIPVVFREPSPRPLAEAATAVESYLSNEDPKGLWARGVMQMQRAPEKAMTYFDRALERNRQIPELYMHMGKLLMRNKKFTDALASFEEAIRLRPEWDLTYQMAGMAANQQGKYDQALSLYDEGLKRNAKNAQLHINRWGALFSLGRAEEALAAVQTALAIDPGNEIAIYDLGKTYVQLDRTPEAEAQLRKLDEMRSPYAARLREEMSK